MIKELIRYAIGDAPKEYVVDDNTLDQVEADFIEMLNTIQEEYGVMFEFKMAKRGELEWRLVARE